MVGRGKGGKEVGGTSFHCFHGIFYLKDMPIRAEHCSPLALLTRQCYVWPAMMAPAGKLAISYLTELDRIQTSRQLFHNHETSRV